VPFAAPRYTGRYFTRKATRFTSVSSTLERPVDRRSAGVCVCVFVHEEVHTSIRKSTSGGQGLHRWDMVSRGYVERQRGGRATAPPPETA